MHGHRDLAVPLEASEALRKRLEEQGVRATLRRIVGDHRLSSPEELQIVLEELEELIAAVEKSRTTGQRPLFGAS